jgi:fatty acid kinase fatty acid binding subunit
MSVIRIVVDSTADLPADLIERHCIAVVPISIQFGTETYKEDIDLDQDGFYRKIEQTHVLPKTSQPSPGEFVDVYRRVASAGDQLISIHVSAKLSGTCQSAQLAAAQLKDEFEVTVIDSGCGSAALGFMAVEASQMATRGAPVGEIVQRLETIRPRVNIYLSPHHLKYLKMSGRVTNVQALIGSVLSLKPIISLEEGTLHPAARIRTRAKAIDHLLQLTKEKIGDRPSHLAIVHAQAKSEADALMLRAKQTFNIRESFVDDLATSLAVHFGPGCLGIVSYDV